MYATRPIWLALTCLFISYSIKFAPDGDAQHQSSLLTVESGNLFPWAFVYRWHILCRLPHNWYSRTIDASACQPRTDCFSTNRRTTGQRATDPIKTHAFNATINYRSTICMKYLNLGVLTTSFSLSYLVKDEKTPQKRILKKLQALLWSAIIIKHSLCFQWEALATILTRVSL